MIWELKKAQSPLNATYAWWLQKLDKNTVARHRHKMVKETKAVVTFSKKKVSQY